MKSAEEILRFFLFSFLKAVAIKGFFTRYY